MFFFYVQIQIFTTKPPPSEMPKENSSMSNTNVPNHRTQTSPIKHVSLDMTFLLSCLSKEFKYIITYLLLYNGEAPYDQIDLVYQNPMLYPTIPCPSEKNYSFGAPCIPYNFC